MTLPCPCCAAPLSDPFYRTGPVPVHSCLMLETAAAAAAFPAGTVSLAHCSACGFVTNVDFDPRWSAYAPDYEDQQCFSPTFNSFAGSLARGLIARYDLSGKHVVEIGCSKGDFLRLLAEYGGMTGTGIDPSTTPGRVPSPARGSFRLISDYYGPGHTDLRADLLCCRHTLEHIAPVSDTLALMRAHMERNPGAVLCIEVPDASRIWETAAFEDVYYEHCSYFTPGSLARALRRAGFALLDLRREYQGQYLVAEATLNPDEDQVFSLEESPAETAADTATFSRRVAVEVAGWQDIFATGRALAIWGSGSKAVAFLKTVAPTNLPVAIVDINPHRAGRYAPGMAIPVSLPADIKDHDPDAIIVMNPIYLDEIAGQCKAENIQGALLPLGQVSGIYP